jgi:agmatinase
VIEYSETMAGKIDPPHRRIWSGLAVAGEAAAEIGILGIPFDGASSFRRGSAKAPGRIRSLTPHAAPFTEDGTPLAGLRLRDYGNVEADPAWEPFSAAVTEAASTVLRHPFALFLGGDHSVTIPLSAATSRATEGPLGILQLDAHLDLMDTFEGLSWSHACTARRILDLPNVDPSLFAFVGARSWLDDEHAYLADHPEVGVHTARDVWRSGINPIADKVCARLQDAAAVYVTIDIDVLDPAFAPGTGTPEAGGVSTRDLLELLRPVFRDLPVRALDLVELSPPLDRSDVTSFAAIKILYEVFGWVREGSVA